MSTQSSSISEAVREVLKRTCQRSVTDAHRLKADLHLDCSDRAELLAALELALRCEVHDFEIDGGITVGDLIRLLKERAQAA